MSLICCIPRKVYDLLIRRKVKIKKEEERRKEERKFAMFLQSVTLNFKPLCLLVFSVTDIFQGL